MQFTLKSLTTDDVKIISTWQYSGEYAIYDEESYEEKVKNNSV